MKYPHMSDVCSCHLAMMIRYRLGTRPLIGCIVLTLALFVIFLNMETMVGSSSPAPAASPRANQIPTPLPTPLPRHPQPPAQNTSTTNSLSKAEIRSLIRSYRSTNINRLAKPEIQSLSRSYRTVIESVQIEYNQRSHCHRGQFSKFVDMLPEFNHFNTCQRIFYNRVPKCGSRSVLSTVRILADRHKYRVIAPPRNNQLSYFNKVVFEDEFVLNFTTFQEPYFYSQHLHYLNFTRYGLQPPIFINVIRDPVERLLSHYFYSMFGSNAAPLSSPMTNKKTLEQCIQTVGSKGCSALFNTVIPFFCGHRKQCREKSTMKQALNQAKRVVKDSFLVVGLQEDLYSFMEVLEVLLPRFFRNATVVYTDTEAEFKRKFATVQKPQVSEEIISRLKEILAHEYEFYHFVKQRFYTLHQKVKYLAQNDALSVQGTRSRDAHAHWDDDKLQGQQWEGRS